MGEPLLYMQTVPGSSPSISNGEILMWQVIYQRWKVKLWLIRVNNIDLHGSMVNNKSIGLKKTKLLLLLLPIPLLWTKKK